jgi:nitrogen fixation NifU-like protein
MSVYRERIIDHYRHPRNQGTMDDADISAELDSPTCGDVVRIDVRLAEGRVAEARFSGHGCVLAMAGASLLTEEIAGKTLPELEALSDADVRTMMGLELGAVREKCALLAYQTLQAGLARRKPGS